MANSQFEITRAKFDNPTTIAFECRGPEGTIHRYGFRRPDGVMPNPQQFSLEGRGVYVVREHPGSETGRLAPHWYADDQGRKFLDGQLNADGTGWFQIEVS